MSLNEELESLKIDDPDFEDRLESFFVRADTFMIKHKNY